MSSVRAVLAGCALALGGCAFVPTNNHPIEDLKVAYAAARQESEIAKHAPSEWSRAQAAYEEAVVAWGTLQDPAVIDHLAYMARQRIAIARETARRVAAEQAVASARKSRVSRGGNPA